MISRQEFHARVSLLDDLEINSELCTKKYLGFYNMVYNFGLFFIIEELYIHGLDRISNSPMVQSMGHDLLLCAMSWPIFYIWSFIALYLKNQGINTYLTIIVPYIYTIAIVLIRDWSATHTLYITCLCCVFSMKTHSFLENSVGIVTIREFSQYLLNPALIYQQSYPMTKQIRIGYLIKKGVLSILTVLLQVIIIVVYIEPYIHETHDIIKWILQLILPITAIVLLIFILIFEQILNFLAELTYFADRRFYLDWWNATTFEELNYMWNRPVHQYLHRHIYRKSLNLKQSKQLAKFITYVYSAILHQFVVSLTFRSLSPIMFGFQMIQIPVIQLAKGIQHTRFGNLYFWFSMLHGVPLIMVLYLKN